MTQIERQQAELLRLQEFSEQLGTLVEPDAILQLAVNTLTETLGPSTSASVALFTGSHAEISERILSGVRYQNKKPPPLRPNGLTVTLQKTGKPIIINDVQQNNEVKESSKVDGVQATMLVPLQVGTQMLGALCVDTIADRRFTESDLQITFLFAYQTAQALKSARYIKRLQLLSAVSKKLLIKQALEPMLNTVCEQAALILGAEVAMICIPQEGDAEETMRVAAKFVQDDGVDLTAVIQKVNQLTPQLLNEGKSVLDNKRPSALCTPILQDEHIVAILNVFKPNHADVFLGEDAYLLDSIAQELSLALSNFELYERLKNLIANAPDGIIGADQQGRIVEFNEAAERILGYSNEEAKQMNSPDFYWGYQGAAYDIMEQMRTPSNDRASAFSVKFKNERGDAVPVRLHTALHSDVFGNEKGSFGYFRDQREIKAVGDLAQYLIDIVDTSNSAHLYKQIVATLTRNIDAGCCLLLQYSNKNDCLETSATYPAIPAYQSNSYALDSLLGQIFEEGQLRYLSKQDGDDATLNTLAAQLQCGALHDCLIVPLMHQTTHQTDCFGLIVLINKQQKGKSQRVGFSLADNDLLNTLVDQIVALLQRNAYNIALQAIERVSTTVITFRDTHEAQQHIADVLVNDLNYCMARFRFILPDGSLGSYAIASSNHNYKSERHILPKGKGITGKVVRTKQPVAVPDLRQNSLFYYPETIENGKLRGMLAVPIFSENEIIGTLSCYTSRPYNFTKHDIWLLSTFANLSAAAYKNATSFKNLIDLERIGEALASKIEIATVLHAVLDNIPPSIKGDGAFLVLFDPIKQEFDFDRALSHGIGTGIVAWNHDPLQHQILVTAFQNHAVIQVDDVNNLHPHLVIYPTTKERLLTANIYSFIGVRLETNEDKNPVGALFINYKDPLTHRDQSENIQLLKIYANQVGVTIDRANSVKRLQQEKQLLESVSKATSALNDIEETWREILQGAMKITGAERGNISQIIDNTNRLQNVVIIGSIYLNEPFELKVSEGIQGWVARHKQPVLISDILNDPVWKKEYVTGNPGTLSELVVPIIHGDTGGLVGIINLESPREAAFSVDDQRLLETLAIQADIAVQNAQRFSEVYGEAEMLSAVYESTKAITHSVERNDILQTILDEAARLTNANFATMQEFKGDHLDFIAIHPAAHWDNLMYSIGKSMPFDPEEGKPEGITVQVAKTRKPMLVDDVSKTPYYVDNKFTQTGSELTVPLLVDNELLGIVNVQHSKKNAFTETDKETLILFGNLAVITLQKEKHANKLSRASAVAAMGAWGADLAHDYNRLATKIRMSVGILKEMPSLPARAKSHLTQIDGYMERLKLPTMPHIGKGDDETAVSNDTLVTTQLDKLIAEIVTAVRDDQENNTIDRESMKIATSLQCPQQTVTMATDWLWTLIYHLIRNGLRAMRDRPDTLTIETKIKHNNAIITVTDKGKGIPKEIIPNLFVHPIPRQNSEGWGLLLVSYVAEYHGGRCYLAANELGKGASFSLELPIGQPYQYINAKEEQ